MASRSITQTVPPFQIMVQAGNLQIAPYRMVDNLCSFHLNVRNVGDEPITFPHSSVFLVDSDGIVVNPISPQKVTDIAEKDSQYLIPYPYVGYYYLEDKEKTAFYSTFDSSLPYYATNYPQDIFTSALSEGPILPGTAIEGDLYFVSDVAGKKSFEIRIFLSPESSLKTPDFVFPFSVEK